MGIKKFLLDTRELGVLTHDSRTRLRTAAKRFLFKKCRKSHAQRPLLRYLRACYSSISTTCTQFNNFHDTSD